jgi:hypothetical protein
MKALLLAASLAIATATTFAQGKVNLINDSASLIVLATDTAMLKAADAALAGQAVGNQVMLPSGVTFVAGLYGGTSSSSLFLYSTVLLNNQGWPAGYIPSTHIVLDAQPNGAPAIPGITSGTAIGATTPWFQVKVWDSAYATFAGAWAAGAYATLGAEFQMNPGPSIAYENTAPPGINSSWQDANIVFAYVPEPSGIALVGLGVLALAASRRHKGAPH